MEDEVEGFVVRDSFGFIVRDDAFLDCLADELVTVDARPIVGTLDYDLVALMEGIQANCALRRFAEGDALLGSFDSVVG